MSHLYMVESTYLVDFVVASGNEQESQRDSNSTPTSLSLWIALICNQFPSLSSY